MRDRDDRNRRSGGGGGGGQRTPDYMSWYKRRTVADVNKRLEQRQRSSFDSPYSKLRVYSPKDGNNAVRILPPSWEPPNHYCLPVWEHKFVGSGNGSYMCLRKMKNQRCPICAEETVARRSGDSDLAKQLAAKARRLCYVLNRSKGAEQPNQPLLWDMSDIQDEEILNLTRDEKNNGAIFPEDPEAGYDLSFTRHRMGAEAKNVKYQSWKFDRDSSPISENPRVISEIMQWLHEHPIPDMLEYHDAKYLEEVMSGTAAEPDEDLDERGEDEDEEQRAESDEDSPLPDRDEDDDEEDEEEEDDREEDEADKDEEDEEEADEEPEEEEAEAEPELRAKPKARPSSNGSRRDNVREIRPRASSSRREQPSSSRYRRD